MVDQNNTRNDRSFGRSSQASVSNYTWRQRERTFSQSSTTTTRSTKSTDTTKSSHEKTHSTPSFSSRSSTTSSNSQWENPSRSSQSRCSDVPSTSYQFPSSSNERTRRKIEQLGNNEPEFSDPESPQREPPRLHRERESSGDGITEPRRRRRPIAMRDYVKHLPKEDVPFGTYGGRTKWKPPEFESW